MADNNYHNEEKKDQTQVDIQELMQIILEEEKKVLHLKKHGMNDKIIELIKARVK